MRRIPDAIIEETVRLSVAEFGGGLAALILTGSMARDEGTIIAREDTCTVLGDAEFVAVFLSGVSLPSDTTVDELCSGISKALAGRGIQTAISISAAHPGYLRNLGREIFAYELRECGRTVWGDRGMLQLIPTFSPVEISRDDAWRLLCNRMIELIEIAPDAAFRNERFSTEYSYRILKLWLDMATSLLVFRGLYAPSYRQRQKVLAQLCEHAERDDAPPALIEFAKATEIYTRFKLHGSCPEFTWDEWVRSVACARSLWRWETARLANISQYESESDDALMEAYISSQPLYRRVRGWLYVLRSSGWIRSWPYWARWTKMALLASPRVWTYAAAIDLFFQLPNLMKAEPDYRTSRELPLPHPVSSHLSNWRAIAAQIALNYGTFLENTRS